MRAAPVALGSAITNTPAHCLCFRTSHARQHTPSISRALQGRSRAFRRVKSRSKPLHARSPLQTTAEGKREATRASGGGSRGVDAQNTSRAIARVSSDSRAAPKAHIARRGERDDDDAPSHASRGRQDTWINGLSSDRIRAQPRGAIDRVCYDIEGRRFEAAGHRQRAHLDGAFSLDITIGSRSRRGTLAHAGSSSRARLVEHGFTGAHQSGYDPCASRQAAHR